MPRPRHRFTTFDDLEVGQSASFTKTVTEADLSHFIAITGDTNPLHVDEELAGATFFRGRIAHGMLTASLLSTVVGKQLPGTGAIYRSQSAEFLKPVRPGDTLTASQEITALDPEANRIEMESRVVNQRGEAVVTGEAVVSLLRAPKNR